MLTIKEVTEYKDFNLAIGAFLDEFSHSHDRDAMIESEPDTSAIDGRRLAISAAVVETLSKEYDMKTPAWVYADQYVMPSPVFAFDTENEDFQQVLRDTSPAPFASRNLFYGDNSMTRV